MWRQRKMVMFSSSKFDKTLKNKHPHACGLFLFALYSLYKHNIMQVKWCLLLEKMPVSTVAGMVRSFFCRIKNVQLEMLCH